MELEEIVQLITSLTNGENVDTIETLLTGVKGVYEQVGTSTAKNEENENWKEKFEGLQKKYVERFMRGSTDEETDETIEEPSDDVEDIEEPEEKSIEELFKKEGED